LRKAGGVERHVRSVQLEIERTALSEEFMDWLASDERHEEQLAHLLSWDAFQRYEARSVGDVTPLTVSSRFIGRN
jgi:predicted SprT family Zn-dependent metalloprotease